jgi:glycosyltransferase involved in cell wall biosynthesis
MVARTMRSLLFSTLYPSSVREGHGVFVETRLRELLRSGEVESRVLAPVPWFFSGHPRFGSYALHARTPRFERHHGIDVFHPRYPLVPKVGMNVAPFLLAAAAFPAARAIAAQGFDFDLIDAHYLYPDGVAAALLAGWLNKPFVVTARGSDVTLIGRHALPRALMRWAAARASAVCGVSRSLVEILLQWGVAPAKLHVLRNGVDLERFRPLPVDPSRAEVQTGGSPVLLMVGHLVELKGHAIVIDALPQLLRTFAGLQLVIVGEGPERGRLEAQVARLGLQSHVRLAGAVPNESLAPWYSAADLLVLASSREGWPNVLLEAMACGTPVVATRVGGVPEIVTSADAGRLVDEREPSALASAIAGALHHRVPRTRVRSHAERFGWRATSEAQAALFAAAVRPHRGRAACAT